jgi:membrane protease YdiL (CAAX protease family)
LHSGRVLAISSAVRHARLALVLGVASALSVALLFPYLLQLLPRLGQTPLPLALLIAIQAIQAGLQFFLLSWIGLRLGASVGLDSPLLRAWVYRLPDRPRTHFPAAAIAGLATGASIGLLDRFVFMPAQPDAIRQAGEKIAAWKGLLASFYGGIGEETLTRLFLMTSLVWLLSKLSRRPAIFVIAAVISALLFAAGHLPAAAQLAPLSQAVVIRVMVLNTGAGIVFGLLYWRWGLEHAMAAHFCADLVLHGLLAG